MCLDVNERIVDEAIAKGCNLIVSHHPLLFRGLKQISDADQVQRTAMKAIRAGVAVVSMHTNMDNARGGVNFKMAEKMGLEGVEFFAPKGGGTDAGSGVIGSLAEPMAADDFVISLKRQFDVECAQCNELLRRPIRRAVSSTSSPASAKRKPAKYSWANGASAPMTNSPYPFLMHGAALPQSAVHSTAGIYKRRSRPAFCSFMFRFPFSRISGR